MSEDDPGFDLSILTDGRKVVIEKNRMRDGCSIEPIYTLSPLLEGDWSGIPIEIKQAAIYWAMKQVREQMKAEGLRVL